MGAHYDMNGKFGILVWPSVSAVVVCVHVRVCGGNGNIVGDKSNRIGNSFCVALWLITCDLS